MSELLCNQKALLSHGLCQSHYVIQERNVRTSNGGFLCLLIFYDVCLSMQNYLDMYTVCPTGSAFRLYCCAVVK
jgi:hypothetical protein